MPATGFKSRLFHRGAFFSQVRQPRGPLSKMSKTRFLGTTLVSLAALASATAVPHANLKRQVSQLRDSYDFVIVGGGTCGLTVADRLTAALPSSL